MAGGRATAQIKRGLRKLGFELQRLDPEGSFAKRRQRLIEAEQIDTVIDVGAHAGEYAQSLRHEGYGGHILSFEPQAQMFARLRAATEADPLWDCLNYAVGSSPGEMTLNVSGNDGFSSSMRPMAVIHEEAEPTSSYVGSETVEVVTLDKALEEAPTQHGRSMLKVDTQGFEAEVLAGGAKTLQRCQLVELELVLVELYEGQALFADLLEQMRSHGFVIADVESGFKDPRTSELLQIDGLFTRSGSN